MTAIKPMTATTIMISTKVNQSFRFSFMFRNTEQNVPY